MVPLRSLVSAGIVEEYPPLADVRGSFVAQVVIHLCIYDTRCIYHTMYICMYVYTCVCVYMYRYIYTYIYVYIDVEIDR